MDRVACSRDRTGIVGVVYIQTRKQSCRDIRPASLSEPSNKLMGDPRNVAHAKKVSQEKHHKEKHAPPKAGPAPERRKSVQTEIKPATKGTTPQAEFRSQLNQQNRRSWRNRLQSSPNLKSWSFIHERISKS